MKASELRERATEDLVTLRETLRKTLFGARMKNHTNQLSDTASLSKTRRDIARIELILHERATAAATSAAVAGGNE